MTTKSFSRKLLGAHKFSATKRRRKWQEIIIIWALTYCIYVVRILYSNLSILTNLPTKIRVHKTLFHEFEAEVTAENGGRFKLASHFMGASFKGNNYYPYSLSSLVVTETAVQCD